MADDLDDGEFWLLPAFLADDALLLDKSMESGGHRKPGLSPCGFGSFGSSSSSGLGSPVESMMGSTETESDDADEEDFLAGLTRRLSQSALQDDSRTPRLEYPKARVPVGSPQSTLLCDLGRGCGCSQGSSQGSPNGPSRGSSPPPPPPAATWDLLYAAAGEVARMKLSDEGTGFYDGRSFYGRPALKPNPISPPVKKNSNAQTGFYYDQVFQQQQQQNFQSVQLQQQLKHIEMLKQQSRSSVWGGHNNIQKQQVVQSKGSNKSPRPLGLSPSAWPPLQHQNQQPQQPQPQPPPPQKGSAMRAVFLDSPGPKRTSVGTGVFLPRRAGTPSESRKKSVGCSTVLLPARVVQALNLNLEEMGAQPHPFDAGTDIAINLSHRNNHLAQQKRSSRPQPAPANHEIQLPQEWTY